jgi:hypothetical protein
MSVTIVHAGVSQRSNQTTGDATSRHAGERGRQPACTYDRTDAWDCKSAETSEQAAHPANRCADTGALGSSACVCIAIRSDDADIVACNACIPKGVDCPTGFLVRVEKSADYFHCLSSCA